MSIPIGLEDVLSALTGGQKRSFRDIQVLVDNLLKNEIKFVQNLDAKYANCLRR